MKRLGDVGGRRLILPQFEVDERRVWYAYAWALHTFLMDHAPEEDRTRFADWQSAMQALAASPKEVNGLGRRTFLAIYARDADAFEGRFRAWVKSL